MGEGPGSARSKSVQAFFRRLGESFRLLQSVYYDGDLARTVRNLVVVLACLRRIWSVLVHAVMDRDSADGEFQISMRDFASHSSTHDSLFSRGLGSQVPYGRARDVASHAPSRVDFS